MKRSFMGLAALALILSSSGCETLGQGRRKESSELLAGRFEPASPIEGARGRTDSARSRGAWSSEAADIETNLTNRSADPSW